MSSSRKGRSDTLSRRRAIPTNRSNVAMVDALSACVPVDSGKPKTWTGAHSSRKFKATPSKGYGGAETPLMSSGKRKLSPAEMVEREEESLLNPSTTPLKRGMKRSERPLLQKPREENSKAAFSRGSAGLDRFGKSVAATSRPTPGKRSGIIRRGVEGVQPVSCTEIEFRNADLHKELFGGHTEVQDGHNFTPVERRPYPSESSVEIGFEFRDMAVHKELFGPSSKAMVPSVFISPLTSSPAHAMVPSVFVSPLTSSPEVLDYSGHAIRVLSSIREEEDAGDGSGKKDLGPLLDEMEDDLLLSANSPLVKEATPLTKIRNNIGCTLTKATSILERLAAMRVDAEKKRREGYWEPKFSSPPQTALMVDRYLPSAKKARLTPKALSSSEMEFVVCEDAKGETPAKTVCIPTDLMSDKENQHRKSRQTGKEKKSKQHDVLKVRSKNVSDHEPGSKKVFLGDLRLEEMSLRKLRAQFKDRIRQLEASKASDLRPWSERVACNTSL